MSEGLEARGTWLRYGRRDPWALEDVTVSIPTGGLTALVGPNGAGKTSLMRLWLGFERPQRGAVRVFGHDPSTSGVVATAITGYVSQEVALYGGFTARDHLRYAASARHGFDGTASLRWLERAAVPVDRAAGRMSGGQRVQLGLALAIGTGARALILDEPLANLDPLARRDVTVHLAEYAAVNHAAVLVSSHLVSDLEGGFETVVVIGNGRVREAGPVAAVKARYWMSAAPPHAVAGEVGRFHARDGSLRVLVSGSSVDLGIVEPATLEDAILGLLSSVGSDGSVT